MLPNLTFLSRFTYYSVMSKILYTTRPLSGKHFTLKPLFDQAAAPKAPEQDDRLYDPALDEYSHMPEVIGEISPMGQKAFGKLRGLTSTVMLKGYNSDQYTVPMEFAPYAEFIQHAINAEHSRTPNAFKRAVLMKMSSPNKGGERWHFDVKAGTKTPVRTYCCTDIEPTEYARIKFDTAKVDFPYSEDRAYEFMLAASGFTRGDESIQAEEFVRMQPFQIARHNGMTAHRGFNADNRTLLTMIYC